MKCSLFMTNGISVFCFEGILECDREGEECSRNRTQYLTRWSIEISHKGKGSSSQEGSQVLSPSTFESLTTSHPLSFTRSNPLLPRQSNKGFEDRREKGIVHKIRGNSFFTLTMWVPSSPNHTVWGDTRVGGEEEVKTGKRFRGSYFSITQPFESVLGVKERNSRSWTEEGD